MPFPSQTASNRDRIQTQIVCPDSMLLTTSRFTYYYYFRGKIKPQKTLISFSVLKAVACNYLIFSVLSLKERERKCIKM